MTGLERLRELAGWADENLQSVWHGSMTLPEELSRITAEMEGEREALVRESEDISGRDADALAWVEKHGGLDEVVARWAGRVPAGHVRRMAERWKDRRERLAAHARSLEGLLAERRREIARLHAEIESMRPRLMPPDKKWPRYKDGAPVNFDDTMTDLEGFELKVKSVEFHPNGFTLHGDFDQKRWYEDDARIDYPEPKVLDADGKPLRRGDIVFDKDTGEKLGVDAVATGNVTCRRLEHGGTVIHCNPEFLTHERPDSWERLEEDARKGFIKYWGCAGVGCDECPCETDGVKPCDRYGCSCRDAMHADILRRALALAERGQ